MKIASLLLLLGCCLLVKPALTFESEMLSDGQKADVCRDWAVSSAHAYASYSWVMKDYKSLEQHYKSSEERRKRYEAAVKLKSDILVNELQPLTAIYSDIGCPRDGIIYSFSCVDEVASSIDAQKNYLIEVDKMCANKIGRYIYETYRGGE